MAELRTANQERIRQVAPRRSGRPWLLVDLLRLPAGRGQHVGRQLAKHTGEEYPELWQLGPDPAWYSRVARWHQSGLLHLRDFQFGRQNCRGTRRLQDR